MNIRGHHLLCIFGFRGLGYNDRFSFNIAKVIDYLQSNPTKKFKTVAGHDVICNSCPHLISEKCLRDGVESDQNVRKHDLRVLNVLGIKPQSHLSFDSLVKIIKKTSEINLDNLCTGCEWLKLGFCDEGISKLQV